MNAVLQAYDLPVEKLPEFYRRLNQPIIYPDGMLTSLGIIYWGRAEHLPGIESAIPKLVEHGLTRFNAVLQAIRTPASSKKLSERTAIPPAVLRILKHDLELWLPKAVPLRQFEWFQNNPDVLTALAYIGLDNQLAVIAAGQNPVQRGVLGCQTNLASVIIDEIVRLCDYYRTGKNLDHLRAKIYYAMGLDTWQKWAEGTSESIIARFTRYIREHQLAEERLVPWPKEVRNGIEWAKMHLEIYAILW